MSHTFKSVCAYIRVSTDDQVELSPDSQRQKIKEYCQKNGYILSDVFEDLGISGKSADKRPGFRHMIAMCKAKEHPFDAIIVWKFSRFARNQEESIVYKSMLRKIGVEVISISEPISEGIGGKLTEAILEIMDEYYSINLSQEVMRGMTEGARRGKIMSVAPFGYTAKDHQYYPDENANTVRAIFDMFVNQGYGLMSIAYRLNQQGVKTRRGSTWENRSIKYIIQNPVYIGKIRWNYATHNGKPGTVSINDEADWIIVDGTHEPIIDDETFKKAQEKIAQFKKQTTRRVAQKHWLSGVLVCCKCGAGMAYHREDEKKHTAPYFVCPNRTRGRCPGQSTKAEWIERDFFNGLVESIESDNYHRTERENVVIDVSFEIKRQLSENDKKLERVKEAYRNGIDTLDEYKANKQLIENERLLLLSRLDKCSSKPRELTKDELLLRARSTIAILRSDECDVQQKADALRAMVDKVVYSKESGIMDFYFLS